MNKFSQLISTIVERKMLILLVGIGLLVVASILFLTQKPSEITNKVPLVVSTTPGNQQQWVPETTPVSIVFEGIVPIADRENIKLDIQPGVNGETQWITSHELRVSLFDNLKNDETYTINVNYKGKSIHKFTFSTRQSEAQVSKDVVDQRRGDVLYAESQKQMDKDFPWYGNMPLRDPLYVVYFNAQLERFSVALNVSPSTEKSKTDALIAEILQKLRALKVPEGNLKYDVTYTID